MIPKIVHVTWKTRDIVNSSSPIIKYGLRNLIDLNPDWKVHIYEDNEIDEYLKNILDSNDYKLIQDKHIVQKSDIWRLFKMYTEGGMYMDLDRLCNKKIVLPEHIKWVLPTCREYDFSHDLMISEPGNPVYAKTIELYLHRRREGFTNVYFLGSQTYMHSITSTIFGKVVNTNPGEDTFKWMREEIEKIPFIMTVREDPPYNTFLYEGNKEDFDHEAMKRSLYSDTGIKHWTGEW